MITAGNDDTFRDGHTINAKKNNFERYLMMVDSIIQWNLILTKLAFPPENRQNTNPRGKHVVEEKYCTIKRSSVYIVSQWIIEESWKTVIRIVFICTMNLLIPNKIRTVSHRLWICIRWWALTGAQHTFSVRSCQCLGIARFFRTHQ